MPAWRTTWGITCRSQVLLTEMRRICLWQFRDWLLRRSLNWLTGSRWADQEILADLLVMKRQIELPKHNLKEGQQVVNLLQPLDRLNCLLEIKPTEAAKVQTWMYVQQGTACVTSAFLKIWYWFSASWGFKLHNITNNKRMIKLFLAVYFWGWEGWYSSN